MRKEINLSNTHWEILVHGMQRFLGFNKHSLSALCI